MNRFCWLLCLALPLRLCAQPDALALADSVRVAYGQSDPAARACVQRLLAQWPAVQGLAPLLHLTYANIASRTEGVDSLCRQLAQTLPGAPAAFRYTAARELGISARYQSDFEASFRYLQQAYETGMILKNSHLQAEALQQTGVTHYYRGDRNLCVEYAENARKLAERVGDKEAVSWCLHIIGSVQTDLAEYGRAEESLRASIRLREQTGRYPSRLQLSYRVLATCLALAGKPQQAFPLLEKVIALARARQDTVTMASALQYEGTLLYNANQLTTSVLYLEEALVLHTRLLDHIARKDINLTLAQAHHRLGNSQKAAFYYEETVAAYHALTTQQMAQQAATIEGKFRHDLLKAEAARQTQQKYWLLGAFGLSLLLIVLGGWLWNDRKNRRHRIQLAEQQVRELQSQMHALIEGSEQERARIAAELHDGLGALLAAARMHVSILQEDSDAPLRAVAERTSGIIAQATSEVRTISHNLLPDSLMRAGVVAALHDLVDRLNTGGQTAISLHLEGMEGWKGDPALEKTIFRILQELLNNALRHAQATEISLTIRQLAGKLLLECGDDGVGFDPALIGQSSGIGWRNLRTRVDLHGGTFSVTSAPGQGTCTTISLPL